MSDTLRYQGRWLLQIGVALFLFTSFDGFAVPHFAVPNLGRSVHTLSAFVGVLFVAMGLVWPTLELGARAARTAFWLLIYSAFATIAAFLIAGVWAPAVRSSRLRRHTWERSAGGRDAIRHVSGRADWDCRVCAHSLGTSRQ